MHPSKEKPDTVFGGGIVIGIPRRDHDWGTRSTLKLDCVICGIQLARTGYLFVGGDLQYARLPRQSKAGGSAELSDDGDNTGYLKHL